MKAKQVFFADKSEPRKKVEDDLIRGADAFERLEKILERWRVQNEDVSEGDYDNPSWSHKQAHRNGYNRALKDVMSLLKLKE